MLNVSFIDYLAYEILKSYFGDDKKIDWLSLKNISNLLHRLVEDGVLKINVNSLPVDKLLYINNQAIDALKKKLTENKL